MTFLDHARRGKNAAWRYAVSFGLGCAMTGLYWTALIVILRLAHALPADLSKQLLHVGDHPSTFYLSQGVMFALLVAGFATAIAIVHRKSPGDIVGEWRWRSFGFGVLIWLVALIASSLLDLAVTPKGLTFTADSRTPLLAISALAGLAAQTFAEEFIFRGYITQGLLLATRRPVMTAVLSGLVFGALHIPNGYPQAANAAVFGIALALIAIRTGGLAFGYGVHLINNLFGAVLVVSAGDIFRGSPGIFTQATSGLMWLDAAAGSVAILLVAMLILRRSAAPL